MINIQKLQPPQVRLMLDCLGIPLAEQDPQIKKLRDQLSIFKSTDPEGYKAAYEIIVEYNTGKNDPIKVIPISEAAKMVNETVLGLEQSAIRTIEQKCAKEIEAREEKAKEREKAFVAAVDLKFKAAVERESKKYNTIAVKINERKEKPVKGVVTEIFPRLIQLAEVRENILLVGPSGCGKTHVAAQLAEALDMRYASQSCSAGISESVFAGWLLPTGENGRFEHVTSVFLDLYENGGVFLLDEADNTDANLGVFLNQAIGNDHFYLPQRYKKPFVKKSKDFIAVAAMNTFGNGADEMYHGRIAQDAAFLDRFRLGNVFMDYSPAIEEALVNPVVLEWGRMVRGALRQHRLKKIMSTRVLIGATKMMDRCEWTIQDIEKGYFADWTREEKAVCGFQSRGVV